MMGIGKTLLAIGLLIALAGGLLILAGRIGLHFGRLPGDVTYRGKHVTLIFPLGTSILVSVLLSLLLYAISRFHR